MIIIGTNGPTNKLPGLGGGGPACARIAFEQYKSIFS
jgi:hypothetical protein